MLESRNREFVLSEGKRQNCFTGKVPVPKRTHGISEETVEEIRSVFKNRLR